MRLTLRTLLAYLDDTLEPHEIKEIGQKVAESDAAQELVARIKQITRRRRLTTPPSTSAGDQVSTPTQSPNTSTTNYPVTWWPNWKRSAWSPMFIWRKSPPVTRFSRLCLANRPWMPPTARRMYGLVKGRGHSLPQGPRSARPTTAGTRRRSLSGRFAVVAPGWMIWALPLAIALLLAALAFYHLADNAFRANRRRCRQTEIRRAG